MTSLPEKSSLALGGVTFGGDLSRLHIRPLFNISTTFLIYCVISTLIRRPRTPMAPSRQKAQRRCGDFHTQTWSYKS